MKPPCITILIFTALAITGAMAAPPPTNSAIQYSSKTFSLISDRNIFDPNRSPRRTNEQRYQAPPRRTDYFTLVGTFSSGDGQAAFFDGSSSQYRKSAKLGENIAGYRISEISHDYVKLAASSNAVISLSMHTQMKRQDDGPWSMGGVVEPSATPTPAPATSATSGKPDASAPAASTGGDAISEVMKRLMQKREQESK